MFLRLGITLVCPILQHMGWKGIFNSMDIRWRGGMHRRVNRRRIRWYRIRRSYPAECICKYVYMLILAPHPRPLSVILHWACSGCCCWWLFRVVFVTFCLLHFMPNLFANHHYVVHKVVTWKLTTQTQHDTLYLQKLANVAKTGIICNDTCNFCSKLQLEDHEKKLWIML